MILIQNIENKTFRKAIGIEFAWLLKYYNKDIKIELVDRRLNS